MLARETQLYIALKDYLMEYFYYYLILATFNRINHWFLLQKN